MAKGIDRKRWLALIVLCLGVLMTVLDTTIVNVALPSIKAGLDFSETSLVWVINAYMLAFGGLLLLGGKLGDIFGHKKLFLIGIALFTLASLACGISNSQNMLIASRAVQGLGGAIVSAVALSLIMDLFTKPDERAKAMGVFGFVAAGGGTIGVFLGGLLTNSLDWHWIFLVNLPVGIIVFLLCIYLLPLSHTPKKVHLDVFGALTVTSSLMLAVYAIVKGNEAGWTSFQTVLLLLTAIALMAVFIYTETKVKSPLMPLRLFKLRNVATSNVVGVLWAASMFAWFFLSALYLQLVLGYTPMKVGLAFLPANLIMAAFSLGLSAKIVMKFGIKKPISLGMFLVSIGLALFSFSPVNGNFSMHVMPGMLLMGIGAGMALNPVLLAAMSDVNQDESGIASGIVNTSFMMGGALGLAVLASLAAARTNFLIGTGIDGILALNSGYNIAFLVGALFAFSASIVSFIFFRESKLPHDSKVIAH